MMSNLKYKHSYIKLTFLIFILLNAIPLHAGNTTLTWNPPTTNIDDTLLTDLAGYKIYYGIASGNYTQIIDIGNVSTYQINNLTDGLTYYFVVRAYDTSANESGNSNEYFETIPVNNPPSANPGGPYTGIEGQSITLDGSGSSDSDGSIALYEWDINNDGTYDYSSASATKSHTYTQQGTYTIKLRVTDNVGATGNTTTTADISDTSPTADFTGSPTDGAAPLSVSFSNNSTGYDQPLTYEWDFDNNGTTDSFNQNPSYSYPDEGTYTVKLSITDSDGSAKTLTRTNYINVTPSTLGENKLSCYDGGNIECLERTDGGSDSDNLDTGKPRLDNIEYKFKITISDAAGNAPQYIKLYMTQRNNPSSGDFYGYDMVCSGDYSTGATCNHLTKLGPAAVHKFFYEAKMSDGTTLRYPDTGYITGPEIQLLTGYNLVGLPRDIGYDSLDGSLAFGSTSTYRWDADLGYYTKVTITEPVKSGEGYFVYKESDTLPAHEGYGEMPGTEFTYEIKYGWNIISNPYAGNVRLSAIKVRKGSNTPVTWTEATSNLWMTNAIYYNNGIDWGSTLSFETGSEATLVPWIGYWIYLNMADDNYYIVIPQP
jgi:PKD repeat protein